MSSASPPLLKSLTVSQSSPCNRPNHITKLAIMSTTNTLTSLYREALRTVRLFPFDRIKPKMRYNIRELFELYRNEPLETRLQLAKQGKEDVNVLRLVLSGPEEQVKIVFSGFEEREAEHGEHEGHGVHGGHGAVAVNGHDGQSQSNTQSTQLQ